MRRLAVLLLAPAMAWAGCVVTQVSETHRDVACSGNVVVVKPRPTTITTAVVVQYPRPESQSGYYPTRVTGIVVGGRTTPVASTSAWAQGGAGRVYYGGTR